MSYSTIQCFACTLSFKQEKKFFNHLFEVHSIDDPEACYIKHVLNGHVPTCQCSVDCSSPISWKGWKKGYVSKFARGHNARLDSIYLNPDFQKQAIQKRKDGFATKKYKVWNAGLSKKTDARINATSLKISKTLVEGYASGRLQDWRLKDPSKALLVAKKMSETKRRLFLNSKIKTWNKGLTKETDARIAEISKSISDSYAKRDAGRRLNNEDLLLRISKFPNFELLSSPDDYKMRRIHRLAFRCVVCNNIQAKSLAMLEETPVCFFCHPKESCGQLELYEFVKSLRPNAILSDRLLIAPKELDIVVPETLAIEYDGLWWHSELFLDDDHAANKSKACESIGIPLLRIFEDEWREKRRIVQSMIKHRLGMFDRRIGARQCDVIKLDNVLRHEFIERTHLDGDVPSSDAWGLIFEGELIAAISIRRPFHKKYDGFVEVSRFCSQHGVSVPGALSRLTRHALDDVKQKGYKGLITYVDKRIGSGVGYTKAGYKLLKMTSPRFWWTDFRHRFNRFLIRADASMSLTEDAVAKSAGVVRIWGCQNMLFEIT